MKQEVGIQCRERAQLERMGLFSTEDEEREEKPEAVGIQEVSRGKKNKLSLGEAELRSDYLK